MPGFKRVYELLKKRGIEFVSISARGLGGDGTELSCMEDDAKRILRENNIVFDKCYWKQSDKLEICKKEKIDIMIEDDYRTVDLLSKNSVKTLYFRDVNLKKLNENEYITEVNNWGDIYRIVWNMLEKR